MCANPVHAEAAHDVLTGEAAQYCGHCRIPLWTGLRSQLEFHCYCRKSTRCIRRTRVALLTPSYPLPDRQNAWRGSSLVSGGDQAPIPTRAGRGACCGIERSQFRSPPSALSHLRKIVVAHLESTSSAANKMNKYKMEKPNRRPAARFSSVLVLSNCIASPSKAPLDATATDR